ncbi:hypothetical protein LCGC14_1139490 [marine sediment metagenome]|uniref:Uncharacterized protein n=1 Tax=marine sediment metagenome TaxID=412755 RepID=A0A0F9Q4C9_9ZZZZ
MSDPIEDAKKTSTKKTWMKAKGICVVLEEDTLKMDLKPLIAAIEQLKNVHSAKFIDDEGMTDHINRIRVRDEYRVKLKELVGLGF